MRSAYILTVRAMKQDKETEHYCSDLLQSDYKQKKERRRKGDNEVVKDKKKRQTAPDKKRNKQTSHCQIKINKSIMELKITSMY